MQDRLDALERFMQDYIVDTAYLDGLKEGKCPDRISAWLSGLGRRDGDGNKNAPNSTSTNTPEIPIQTVTSLPNPPSDSYYSSRPNAYASDLPERQAFQVESQPAQQGYDQHLGQPMSEFDQSLIMVNVDTHDNDARSTPMIYTAPQFYEEGSI